MEEPKRKGPDMIDKNNNGSRLHNRSPEVKVIELKAQGVLCGSNEPMGENDITDAFHQD